MSETQQKSGIGGSEGARPRVVIVGAVALWCDGIFLNQLRTRKEEGNV